MPRSVLIDEFHLSLFVPQHLTAQEQRAIRRALTGSGFRARLVRAARSVVRRFPSLNRIRLTLSR
jgi:hypothetical protein